jgi:2',3'-cyclic-nucleotide 2'-phosphodiesterase (5'-nucleotidase family)
MIANRQQTPTVNLRHFARRALSSTRAARAIIHALLAMFTALTFASSAMAAVLAGWDVNGQSGGASNFGVSPLPVTTAAANVTVEGLTRGTGVSISGTGAARAWGGTDWQTASAAAAVSGNDFVTFKVTANAGYQISFTSIPKFDYRRSATGAGSGLLQYQLGNGAFNDITTLAYSVSTSGGGSIASIDLSGIAALQNVPAGTTVTFRIVNFGGTTAGGTWYVFDVANSTALDLEVDGTVAVSNGAVNGACGPANGQTVAVAPSANLCSIGIASVVSGNGPWSWTCAGSNGGSTASCSANKSAANPFTIFHMNDVHARLTPHKWVISQHGSNPDVFEDVGGAAHLAGKMLSLTAAKPDSLVLDGGDISEGNPVGDMNCTGPGGTSCSNSGYGNGGMTAFYEILHSKLKLVAGRNNRGIDALVVGNHDVRDVSYITNMEHMAATGVPVVSVNVRDISTHLPHFLPYTTVTVNGTKIGVIGYTTSSAQVGASLASTLEVVDCQWTGAPSGCNISTYVNELRNTLGVDIVILLTHDGHSDLVDPVTPVIADTGDAKVPEIAITGHWHTWSDTVWQPFPLNYKTLFAESSSYMKYIGELNVDASGGYVSAAQHVLRNSEITPDPAVELYVNSLISQYNSSSGAAVDRVVGYTNDNLLLDNRMKWWSADEYPWNGNNTAGQWITDAMKWKCDQIWSASGGCDLAVEAGGGVRSDIPAGPVTFLHVYETFPWADDTYVRISMTGQDIINFLKATNMGAGFSAALDVTAFDGIATSVLMNGAPIGLSTVYKVAINNYMLAHPPSGYTWPAGASPESDPSATLVRDSLVEFMVTQHATPATAYSVGGDRYHFNGEYSGGYRAVVTMMNDNDSKPTFEDAFIRLLSATPETLTRRGSKQVPVSLVNADGSVNPANRLAEQELYRSFLGFKTGALQPGDIIEVWGKASFFGGNPEFVDQEGVYGNGLEFRILGHDASLAKPVFMSSIGAFLNDNYKNHYVKFLATKTAADTVVDQNNQSLKIWDKTGFAAATLPGTVGQVLEVSGVLTMESFGYRLRSDQAAVSASALPAVSEVSSRVDPQPSTTGAPLTLTATASITGATYALAPLADAQVASGSAAANFGTTTNLFVESSTAAGTFGIERAWLKFSLAGIPSGSIISNATLQLWNWKSTGVSLPVEVRSGSNDSWTETGITYANQPAFGGVLDTQTLASGAVNAWYGWNVTPFVVTEFAGDKTVSLLVKPVDEALAGAPSYGFDAKEFGSNAPVLRITTQANASAVGSVRFFYRFSADNLNWGGWTQTGGTITVAPYNLSFNFQNGAGYYEFYSLATDNLGTVEPVPAFAQASVHFQPTGAAQTISFPQPSPVPVGSVFSVTATASSGLPVTFGSSTPGVCTVSLNVVSAIGVGICTVAASQSGDPGIWLPVTLSQRFAVQALSQSITFAPLPNRVLGSGSFTLSAAASPSNLPVQFASLTNAVCSVSGVTVSLVSTGTCQIIASQPGSATYAPAPSVTQSFAVTGASAGSDGDVPLPPWAQVLLALSLLTAIWRRTAGFSRLR